MKIIGICGSPRKNSNSEILVREALKSAEEIGIETELILLRDKNIEFCDGCCTCDTTKKCHKNDDMKEIIKKLVNSDAIIFATPTYFDDVDAMMKNFLDRLNPLGVDRELKNKLVGIIAVGAAEQDSRKRAVETLKKFSEIELMKVVDSVIAKAYKASEVLSQKEALISARKLGKRIVNVIE